MRLIGIILLSAVPIIIGAGCYIKSKTALRQTEAITALTDEISSSIRYRAITLDEIMAELSQNEHFSILGFDGWIRSDGEFSKRAADFINSSDKLLISKEAKTQLVSFLSSLGQSDIYSQEKLCKLYRSRFETMLEFLRDDAKKRQKLYCTLGVLGAAFIFIMLL